MSFPLNVPLDGYQFYDGVLHELLVSEMALLEVDLLRDSGDPLSVSGFRAAFWINATWYRPPPSCYLSRSNLTLVNKLFSVSFFRLKSRDACSGRPLGRQTLLTALGHRRGCWRRAVRASPLCFGAGVWAISVALGQLSCSALFRYLWHL